jgi:osmoprotectant transport system permease protein
MRRESVLIILLVILLGLTVWITSLGRIGVSSAFTYDDILIATKDHLVLVFLPVLAAVVICVPLGILGTRPGFTRMAPGIIGIGNVGQSIPSLAIIAIMATLPFSLGFFHFGFNFGTAIVALFIYGMLPILRNSYTSMKNITPAIIESARGMGMTRWQIMWKIEWPLAIPVIMTGIRVATIVTVGTAELAALIGVHSLGWITLAGVYSGEPLIILQGAAPTAFLAISLGYILERIENWITPKGLKIGIKTT